MKIPIIFLGTGQAIPTAKRNHPSIFLQYKNESFLIDCGEGTQRQFRRLSLNPCKLTKLLITHWHGDHMLGIPGLLQTLALNGYKRKLEIYGPKGTEFFIKKIMSMFVFQGKINYEVREVTGKFFENKDFCLEAESMKHTSPCLSYSFVEKDKLRIDKRKLKKLKIKGKIVGELARGKDIVWQGKKILAKDLTFKQKGKKITIILDTAKDSDLLICEATYIKQEEDLAQAYKHLTSSQAAGIAKKSKSRKLILTHISQRYENKERIILEEARKIFKNSFLVEDLEKIEI